MPFLARLIRKPRVWVLDKAVDSVLDSNFPARIVCDLLHGASNGVSFFEVPEESTQTLARVAVAVLVNPETKSFEPCSFRLIDVSDPARLGIAVKSTNGNTADRTVDSWHRDLDIQSCSQAIEVARLMLRRDAFHFSKDDLAEAVRVAGSSGCIDTRKAKGLLASLLDGGQLQFRP